MQNLRFALRMIISHRWFSLAVIITLALGIGINTTVFTLVNAVLFKPVPVPDGERIVTVAYRNNTNPRERLDVSWPDYLAYKEQNRALEGLEAMQFNQATISEPNNPPERFRLGRATPGLFDLIKTPPIVGRSFTQADGRAGAEAVVLLGHAVWQQRYAGAMDAVGRSIRVNGQPATIIGVMPAGFKFPNNEDFWMPLVPTAEMEKRGNRPLQLFALLKPGVSVAEANLDLGVVSGRLSTEFPETNKDITVLVRTFHETYNGDQIRMVFLLMLGAVGFVLLIACANVANMMLSRAIVRARELAVRASLGATRGQLVRQMLVESVLLSLLGGLLGLGISAFSVQAFDVATQDVGKPYWIEFTMDWRAFGYFAAISIASGIAFGLVPALRASRVDLNTALKDGTPGGGGNRASRLTAALVVFQFALTVVLLAGAGLMIRSFFAVQTLNPFVRPESIFTARLQLPEGKGDAYETATDRWQFFQKLLPQLQALPGVTAVAAVNSFPGLGTNDRPLEFDGRPNPNPQQPPRGSMNVETPNYLATIGVPILQGRDFTDADGEPGQEVAIISRTFALRHWPDESPLGRRFRYIQDGTTGPWLTVIGVSADLVQDMRDPDAAPLFHVPYRQQSWGWMGLLIRTSSDPGALAAPVRAAVQRIDQDLPLFEVRTLTVALERQRWFLVVFGTLFLTFALIGLLMAAVGIYAVVAQATARRTREIGIRMALGATANNIARLVLKRGLLQLGLGLFIGLGGAFGATHLMFKSRLVMQVSPNDPLIFISIMALLIGIGFAACYLPARRATKVNPSDALRAD